MVAAEPPPGVPLTRVARTSLEAMLLGGQLDAVIASRPPGEPGQVRALLGEDARAVEEAYWREHRVFPIMHTVVIRRDVHEAHPRVAPSLYRVLDAARRRSLDRLLDPAAPYFPLPWASDSARRCRDLFDGELWPYGVEPNRRTLETFCRYAFEQGVCVRPVTPEELFPAV
jgi:4,5-dihydroxyphthalate decarboxylase